MWIEKHKTDKEPKKTITPKKSPLKKSPRKSPSKSPYKGDADSKDRKRKVTKREHVSKSEISPQVEEMIKKNASEYLGIFSSNKIWF